MTMSMPEHIPSVPKRLVGLAVSIAAGVGMNRYWRPIQVMASRAAAASSTRLQSSTVVHSGFSISTCLSVTSAQYSLDSLFASSPALDVHYAKTLGVNTDELLIPQPDTGEQALEIVEVLVRSGAVDVLVVDSVAALVPRAEIEGEMGDSHMGLQARLMSQALRKLTANIQRSNTMVVFINQIRMKIGVMFGSPETTTGGNALKFYSSVRLDIRRIGAIKKGDEVLGNRTKVKVTKNKLAPPFRVVEFDIMYGKGVSREAELVDMGVVAGAGMYVFSAYFLNDPRALMLGIVVALAMTVSCMISGMAGVLVPVVLKRLGADPATASSSASSARGASQRRSITRVLIPSASSRACACRDR